MRIKKSEDLEDPIINLTPLIDVVFVVLIMFILIAPLLEVDLVELAESGVPAKNSQSSALAVYVRADDSVWLQKTKVSIKDLESLLKKEKLKGQRLQLFQDKKASFGTYQSVKNAAEAAGFEEMEVLLRPS